MRVRAPETQTMKISDVKAGLSSLVNEVYRNERRVVVEKAGIPVAALISIDDLKRLKRLDEDREERWRLLDLLREPFQGVPPEEVERETAKAVAEVRADMKAERDRVAKSA
jgi:prevent-host-death family protein